MIHKITVSSLIKEVELRKNPVISTVNEFTERVLLAFPEESVTIIVQSEYVPSSRAVKVMLLLPEDAEEVELLQLPPYEMVPESFDENV